MVVGYQAICRKVARPGGPQGDESRAELSQNAAPSICWAIHRHPRGLPESGPAPTATPPANRVGRIKERRGRHQVIQEIGAVCRQVALRRAQGDESPARITARSVAVMLGDPPHADEVLPERMRPGVAMGLARTPFGGNVLLVEARRMRGDGRLTLTGQLWEVMKESARAALSWLRANAERHGVDPGFYETAEVHLHVPAGGIPKDGPSAGVAIAAALVSALTGRTVRRDRAMTGEISLSGDVLPVGGVKEKVLAARRLGIAEVILPKAECEGRRQDPP